MFEIQCYHSFIITILIFQLIPGAGTIAILSATANHGIKSGMSAVCGILLGDFLYMLSAALGLATLLQGFPAILKIAQYIGALYLCFLGLQKILSNHEANSLNEKRKNNKLKTFKQSLTICLANPKAILFFMAFFPLFLSKEAKPMTLVAMMFHVTIISATRLAGVALIAFGIKLAKNIE